MELNNMTEDELKIVKETRNTKKKDSTRISNVGTPEGARYTAMGRINNVLRALQRLDNITKSYWNLTPDEIKSIHDALDTQVKLTKAKLKKRILKQKGDGDEDGPFKWKD